MIAKTTREYESRITKLAAKAQDSEFEAYKQILDADADSLNNILGDDRHSLHTILKDDGNLLSDIKNCAAPALEVRRTAYYILFTSLRRKKEVPKCMSMYIDYESKLKLSDDFFAQHLYSTALKEAGTKLHLQKSIKIAENLFKQCPNHPGLLNNLARGFHFLAEIDGLDSPQSTKKLKRARELIEQAIAIEESPKFDSTKANILSCLGEHKDALRLVDKAIRNEDSAAGDYVLRVSEYLFIKSTIVSRQIKSQTASEFGKQLRRTMEEAQRSNFQTLSLFVAVIGFVIGAIHLTITSTAVEAITATEAIQMLFALASAILMVLSGFTLLYSSDGIVSGNSRFWLAFFVAVVILLFGLVMPTLLDLGGNLL